MNRAPAHWLRMTALFVAACVVSAFAVLATAPNIVRGPKQALFAQMPLMTSPTAQAVAAAIALAEDQEQATLAQVESLASAAVLKDPMEESAVRSLSFVRAYQGRDEEAMRLLRYGESLSRRDLMTELAIAIDAKQKEGDAAAIRHYGHALSTTRQGYDIIVAQVVASAGDIEFARALGKVLGERPIWRQRFFGPYLTRSKQPESVLATVKAMWPDGVPAEDLILARRVVEQLLAMGAMEEAAEAIDMVTGDKSAIVRDGGFDSTLDREMGWNFRKGASLSALPVPAGSGSGKMLEMRASSGRIGRVARQIITIEPGNYTISAKLWANEEADANQPKLRLQCADTGIELVALPRERMGRTDRAVSRRFSISEGCPVQYLDVEFGSSIFVTDSRGWADDIAITKE